MNVLGVKGVLQGREIYWCPDGGGHTPYCPGPIDPDDRIYCCTWYAGTGDIPSCCKHPIATATLATIYVAAFVGALWLFFILTTLIDNFSIVHT
uniref:Uncharacterized protein n=1 Tax=Steinernema glaseri TaxID=37863 RepID=A0A1I8A653_9BILA